MTPIRERARMPWRLPVFFIAVTHVFIPVLLFRSEALRTSGGWIGATLLVSQMFSLAFTSGVLALRWSPLRDAETGLTALMVFMCLPVVIVTYLGLVSGLSLTSVLITTGAAEIALLMTTRKDESHSFSRPATSNDGLGFTEKLLLGLAVLAFGILALNAIRYTPSDSDTMWYHLPLLAEWIKTKSIAPVPSIPLMARGYPGAREAILAWLSFPMTSDNLAFLSLVEVPGSCLAIFAICREFGVSQRLSLGLAALFSTTPEVSMWVSSQKNDLFLALVFLLTFFFMLRWLRTGSSRYAVLGGFSGGLLCAAKLSGPPYLGALAIMFVGTLALRKKPERPDGSARAIALMFVLITAVAAPWYIRNIAYFRNPFYPKEVSVFGKILFAGPLGARFFSPITLGFDFPRLVAYRKRFVEGLGVALPALAVTPLLLLVLFRWRHRWRMRGEALLWLAALPALLLAVYMVQPFSLLSRGVNSWDVQPRFLLPFLACLHITMGFLMSRVPRAARFGLPIIGLAALGNLALWTHFWWLLGVLAFVTAMIVPLVERALHRVTRLSFPARRYLHVGVIIFIASIAACHWMDGFRERSKDSPEYGYSGAISAGWGQVSLYIRHNVSNKRILCLGRPENFPLYGRGYTNNLYSTDDSDLMEFVQKNRIDYVVGFRPFTRHGSEGEVWEYLPAGTKALRERYPENFQLVYTSDGAEVVKVLE
jgi:hypothetical protein